EAAVPNDSQAAVVQNSRGALVRAISGNVTGRGTIFLVDSTARRFAFGAPLDEVRERLGYAETAPALVPIAWANALADGPELSIEAARKVTAGDAQTGLTPDGAGAAPLCEANDQPAWIRQSPWGLARLGAPQAWERYGRGAGIVVAVVDSGVEARNPHLRGAVTKGTSFTDNDIRPDGTTSIAMHGTAVATIIAAREVPPSKLVGVAPEATILPIRYFQSTSPEAVNSGNAPRPDRLAAGIRYAADHGAKVINVSSSQPTPDARLEEAVRYAQGKGALVVASAGNDREDNEPDGPRWPAAYPGVLGVTATDVHDQVTPFTIHSAAVDVAAPGQEVPVGMMALRDCLMAAGDSPPATSWATAYVSGAAALVWSAHPDATAEEVAYRLMASADRPLRGDRDDRRGWGVVNAYEAASMTLDPARPGPAMPGHKTVKQVEHVSQVSPGSPLTDPLQPARESVAWWSFLGAAGVGLLLLLTRWNRLVRGRSGTTRTMET
ncbi:MAG TPA: S8 family serine peptidase, partial [Nocardioidaceae bacterium]|nr:S8 family serine peptidase [Nocardioidaceae bacterium]